MTVAYFFLWKVYKKNIAIVISWDVCNLWISLAPLYVHNCYGVNSVNYKLICVEWIKHKFTFVKDYWWFEFPQIEILSSMDIPLMLWCHHQYFMLLVHNFIKKWQMELVWIAWSRIKLIFIEQHAIITVSCYGIHH